MTKAYQLKPFDVIRVNPTCYQIVLAIQPDMSLGGDNDTYLIFVLEQNGNQLDFAGEHKRFRCDPSDTFEVYAQAKIGW
jgi:hypothetical protein